MHYKDLYDQNTCFCSWGRTALYLALMSVGVRGREVLLPAFTCATNVPTAIYFAGGIPVFVDVETDGLGMDIVDLESKITDKTGAIISHSYYGFVPQNISQVQQTASARNVVHIFDNSHAWGTNPQGDATVYSFSKSFTTPAGGAVVFRSNKLFKQAKAFQFKNRKLFHETVTDSMAYSYMKALAKDRSMTLTCDLRYSLCKRLISKASRTLRLYTLPDFYSKDHCYALFDTRITAWQQESVKSILLTQDRLFQTRKEKAKRIFELLQPVSCVGTFPVYSCFVDDIPIMEEQLRPLGIKTRRVWPVFQAYTEAQMTENVRFLKEHLLLLDTDSLTMENMEKLRGLRHHAL